MGIEDVIVEGNTGTLDLRQAGPYPAQENSGRMDTRIVIVAEVPTEWVLGTIVTGELPPLRVWRLVPGPWIYRKADGPITKYEEKAFSEWKSGLGQ